MKAYIYIRYSTPDQRKGDSETRQRELAKSFCARHPHLGIDLQELSFVDDGVSGYRGGNLVSGSALNEFMSRVANGEICKGSALVVESLDRITRQELMPAFTVLLEIINSGIVIVVTSPAEQRVYSKLAELGDILLSLISLQRANQESALKSNRLSESWKRKRANAKHEKLTSRCPAWLSLSKDRKSFHVDQAKADVVRKIFSLAEAIGQMSIARHLNQENTPVLTGRGKKWQTSSIVKILSSDAVYGLFQPHKMINRSVGGNNRWVRVPDGDPISDYFPVIIPKSQFDRVMALRSARTSGQGGRKGAEYSNLFTSIARCGACNAQMHLVNKGKPPKGGKYLVCSNARLGAGCKYILIPYAELELDFFTICHYVDFGQVLPDSSGQRLLDSLRSDELSIQGELMQANNAQQNYRSAFDAAANLAEAIPKYLMQSIVEVETKITKLEGDLQGIRTEIELESAAAEDLDDWEDKFIELVHRLEDASVSDRFVLRAKINNAIKIALASLKFYSTDAAEIRKLYGSGPGASTFDHGLNDYIHPTFEGKLWHFVADFKNGRKQTVYCDRASAFLAVLEGLPNGTRTIFLWRDRSYLPKRLRGIDGKFVAH